MEDLETALSTAINLAPAVTRLVGASAFTVDSTSGYTGTINLADLVQHGIIEHDASISRADTVTGDALTFNEAIWESTFALFTSSTITVAQIAAARQARIAAAATTVNAAGLQGGLLEMAALMRTFQTTGGAGRAWVDVFFREYFYAYIVKIIAFWTSVCAIAIFGLWSLVFGSYPQTFEKQNI